MADFKRVSAQDNPDHENIEAKRQAQRDRDAAELRKQEAIRAGQAGRQTSYDERAFQAQQGNGPAGLNKGPSDTVSPDPHRPLGYPQPGDPSGGLSSTTGGTGTSPPTRPQPPSDKPEDEIRGPAARAFALNPTDENKEKAKREQDERNKAKDQREKASDDLRKAESRIADNQSKSEPARAE